MTDKADKIKEYKKKSNKMQEQEVRTISRLKSMSIFLCHLSGRLCAIKKKNECDQLGVSILSVCDTEEKSERL